MSNSVLSIQDVQKSLSLNSVTNFCGANPVYPTTITIPANDGVVLSTQTVKFNFPSPSNLLLFNSINITYTPTSALTTGDTLEIDIQYDTSNGSGFIWPLSTALPLTIDGNTFNQNIQNIDSVSGQFTQGTITFKINILYRTTGTTPLVLSIYKGVNNGSAVLPLAFIP